MFIYMFINIYMFIYIYIHTGKSLGDHLVRVSLPILNNTLGVSRVGKETAKSANLL